MPARSFFPMLVVVLAQTVYQVAQKFMPAGLHPFAVFTLVYAVAATLCLGVLVLTGTSPLVQSLQACLVVPSLALALAVVGIEAGFLILYRNGGVISTAYATSSAATMLLLFLIGALWLREPVTSRQLAGVLLAAIGIWLATAHR